MKKLIIILLVAFIGNSLNAATFTSIISGNWSNGSTWDQSGTVPTIADDIIIAGGHTVTANSTDNCHDLTINAGGILLIETGAILNSDHNVEIAGTLTMTDGVLNSGSTKYNTFNNNGGVLNFSGDTINIAGRFSQKQTTAQANISGSGVINISTVGEQTVSSYYNFSVTGGGTFSVASGSTVQLILKNGNNTTKEEVYYSPATSNFDGGSFIIENNTALTGIYIDSDMPIYKIESRVGAGDTLHFNLNSHFSITDFSITSGITQVDVGAKIDITGVASFGNANALVIESTAAGNGSLIASGTVTGTAKAQRYIQSYTSNNDGWHEISSPVDNMVISGSNFEPASNEDFYAWGENANLWLNYKVAGNGITNFNNGSGYMVAYSSTGTKNFTGTLNTSDIMFSNLSVGAGSGWHLLGNPYSSALKWKDGNWALSNISTVAKIWDEIAGNYADIATNGYIPSTNGFFVQAVATSNSITIPAAARVHNSANNFKNTTELGEETLLVKVSGDKNSYSDITTIGFNIDASAKWDIEFDSRKLFGNDNAPQLWTITKGEELSTDFLPPVMEALVLPMNFKAGYDGNYELDFENVGSFYANSIISLEDKFTGDIIDILDTPHYSFEGSTSDAHDRFLLHFYGITDVKGPQIKSNDYQIYTYNKTIYVKPLTNKDVNGKLIIYNTLGQVVFTDAIHDNKLYSNSLNLNKGYYVASFISGKQVVTTKIIVN